jgi:hypothetical protein
MEKQISEMVAARVEAKYLNIKQMRNPGQWMPIARIAARKGPADGLERQAVLNLRILGNVLGVVEIVKFVVSGWPIEQEGDEGQQEADPRNPRRVTGLEFGHRALHYSSGSITKRVPGAKPIRAYFSTL